VTLDSLRRLDECGRLTDVVSRGGSFTLEWMHYNGKENPLYERYDDLLDIARKYDATLSLGDGLRPGSLEDATDLLQVSELVTIGELVARANRAGVQAMVEGPGHVPLNEVEANVTMQKKVCKGAPFYVLGPIVTDVSAGFDHIAAAIGGAVAAAAGADFLCYVTPSEHLRLPNADDVREGVVALRVAAHAGDIVKGVPGAREWDEAMSRARKALDWNKMLDLAIYPPRAKELRESSMPSDTELCTMCGEFCAMKKMEKVVKKTG
jgi:phosphomethylpyrimidine synthase